MFITHLKVVNDEVIISYFQRKKFNQGHDGSGFCSGWFLDKVVIQNMSTSEMYYFLCGRWLASSEEDGQIVRELIPRDSDNENSYLKTKKYGITIFTGDVMVQVQIQMYL